MTITQLTAQQVQPSLFAIDASVTDYDSLLPKFDDWLVMQPRIGEALSILCDPKKRPYCPRFMLLKASESELFFSMFKQTVSPKISTSGLGYAYHFNENKITLTSAKSKQDNFSVKTRCIAESIIDNTTLFGCVRQPENGHIKLQSGFVHDANGGVLILGLRSLLSQPSIWFKLKRMVLKQEFEWFSTDDSHPLPIAIPPLPLDLRIILVGDRLSLAELQDNDPELYDSALYAEFENELHIQSTEQVTNWLAYVKCIAQTRKLPNINQSSYPILIKEGVRFTGDQYYLPLSIDWINHLLVNASYTASNEIDAVSIKQAISKKNWRENYLLERFQEEIFTNQITINTKDKIVGQINGLSVIEYPGYPKMIGEPTRLSCLVHFGDGELIDIERKTELAGSIHTKGMMIMQAFIMSEFAMHHQLPFSTSLVFEQSYNEIDGDSASLAGLCVLMSALSGLPIDQQLAVTGSVDQFGHVQSIGGINEKIEGFFAVCQHQGLTGEQGVIIPYHNQRHLCLNDEVTQAIKEEKFSIITVEHVAEALYLLTGVPYKDEEQMSIYKLIQARIQLTLLQDRKSESWLTKLRKCCKKQ